jgi:hypothetical protein
MVLSPNSWILTSATGVHVGAGGDGVFGTEGGEGVDGVVGTDGDSGAMTGGGVVAVPPPLPLPVPPPPPQPVSIAPQDTAVIVNNIPYFFMIGFPGTAVCEVGSDVIISVSTAELLNNM